MRERTMNTVNLSSTIRQALCAVLLVGCSATPEVADTEPAGELTEPLPAGCSQLDSSVVTHVCMHPSVGPYQTITGTANPPTLITGDHYYVTLNFTADSTSPFEGSARYSPPTTTPTVTDYAIHYEPSAGTITVRDKNNTIVNPVLSGSNTTCAPSLQAYKVYPLSSSTSLKPYKITIGRTTTPKSAHLVVERLDPQSRYWYVDSDGDGWGDPATEFRTYCSPPATHTVNQGFDCNDSNPGVYPGNGC
jgi:hypothetical protein